MTRTESILFQVYPNNEKNQINLMQQFQGAHKSISYVILLFSIFALTLLPCKQTYGQGSSEQIRVTAEEANIRSGAGINFPVILTIMRGTILPIIRAEGDWYQVRLSPELGTQQEVGYIHNSIIETVERSVVIPPPVVNNTPRSSQRETNNYQGTSSNPEYKEAEKALLYGMLIPGGGHFYSGETKTGGILLGAAILAPVLGTMIAADDAQNLNYNLTPIYLGVAVTLGAWVYSIVDGPKAAERMNIMNGLARNGKLKIYPDFVSINTSQVSYGVRMRFQF